MNADQFEIFLSGAAAAAAVGALINLSRLKSRGASAILLASALLCFSGLCLLLKAHASQAATTGLGAVMVALLIADVVVRAKNPGSGGSR